jgi:hypothetical protein
MLTEVEYKQIETTLEYACFIANEDMKAVILNDILQILGGYVCSSSSSGVTIPFSTVHDHCRREL